MSLYDDRLTMQVRQLTQDDVDATGGTITLCRAGMPPVDYPFEVGDFLCQKMVGLARDAWVMSQASFATTGWFAASPPDDSGFVIYGGSHITEVTDLDNGYFQCSAGCMVDDETFWASHVPV